MPKPITPAAKKPLIELKPGDRIVHRSFGAGEVKSVTPMPGDALVTVAFDSAGEKKMLLKTASAFITKE